MALRDTEYMYISARIKAREGQTTYNERVKSYLECKSLSDLCSLVLSGVTIDAENEREALEEYFDEAVKTAFALVRENAPDPKYFDFLLYEYDACNLKVLIKCMLREISPDGMLYEFSTVSPQNMKIALDKRSFDDVLPGEMARSAVEAIEAYARTGDARLIDLIIDKACFADMLENSRLCGCKLAQDLIKIRIDSINIITFQRILKSEIADKISTYDMAFIENGNISKQGFIKAYENEDYTLMDVLDGTKFKDIVSKLGTEYSFAQLERALDMAYLARVNEEKYVPFGVEVVCSYLINTLFEAKNARIIIAGLVAGLSEEKIRERVRL